MVRFPVLAAAVLALAGQLGRAVTAMPDGREVTPPDAFVASEVWTLFEDFADRANSLSHLAFGLNLTTAEPYSPIIDGVDGLTDVASGFLPSLAGATIPESADGNKVALFYANFVFDHQVFLQALSSKASRFAGTAVHREVLVAALRENKEALFKLASAVADAAAESVEGRLREEIPRLDESFDATISGYEGIETRRARIERSS